MPGCRCCNSPYLDFINNLLLKGKTTREISKRLKEECDVSISHMSVARHFKNHLLPKVQEHPLKYLDELGRSRLRRAISKGVKIFKTRHRCTCRNPTSFRRSGIAYVCRQCGGWFPADEALGIMRRKKKEPEIYIESFSPEKRW